jgi:hypothetical protein
MELPTDFKLVTDNLVAMVLGITMLFVRVIISDRSRIADELLLLAGPSL